MSTGVVDRVAARSTPWIIDGGLSTALEELGVDISGPLWTAKLLIDRPGMLTEAHRRFVEAGADIVITASYQASEAGLQVAGLSATEARRALASTTDLARAAQPALVAASVGPFGAAQADGSEYHGRYSASWTEVRDFHRRKLQVLVDSGPDLLAVETVPSVVEVGIILDELASLGCPPAWVSVACVAAPATCAGDHLAAVAHLAVSYPALVGVGVNCCAPAAVGDLVGVLAETTPGSPLVAYPNHGGTWDAQRKVWVDDSDTALHDLAPAWIDAGVRLVGGCCGNGPAAIADLADLVRHLTPHVTPQPR